MRFAVSSVFLGCCTLAIPARASAQVELPTAGQGYTITMTSSSEDAPAGYMGHTDKATQTSVGREPNVVGRQYITYFTLANKIRNCPNADGTAEGDGEFTVSGDYTRRQGSVTSASHYSMSAKATYKGKVGEDGWLDGPVTANIDYVYQVTGGTANRIDPTNPAPIYTAQHISIQFTVGKKLFDGPVIGAFSGGDPTQGHLEQANAVGLALTYFAGIYYGFAETQWLTPNKCVQVVFDPPGNSRQPVPGSDVKVNAYIKTKGGEDVRGRVPEVHPHNPTSETVAITSSATDPGSPAIFTYTAPKTKVNNPGFSVGATSRGGAAQASWDTGLGTNWSGQITATKVSPGVDRNSDVQTVHHYEATRITINVKDGVGTADGFSEIHGYVKSMHPVAANGTSHLEFDYGSTDEAMAQGQVKASAGVMFSTAGDRYTLSTTLVPFPVGKRHTTSCTRDKCTSQDQAYGVQGILSIMSGKVDDPNHVHGSMNLGGAPMFPGATPVAGSYIIMWDLARTGTTK